MQLNCFQAQIFFGRPCHDASQELLALLSQLVQLVRNWIGQVCLPPIARVAVEVFWMPIMSVDPMVEEVAGLLFLLACQSWCCFGPLEALTAGVVVV